MKAAVEGLSRSWAHELGGLNPQLGFMKGTTSNAVSVGFTDTNATRKVPPQVRERIEQVVLSRQSLGPQVASSEDVAGVVGFLCEETVAWSPVASLRPTLGTARLGEKGMGASAGCFARSWVLRPSVV